MTPTRATTLHRGLLSTVQPLLSPLTPDRLRARQFVRPGSSGKSGVWHVVGEAADGSERPVVMKHRDCEGTQSHGLAAEMLAALFALDLGIPVQPPLIVSIESGFAASLTDPYLRGIGNKNIGPNFATDQWKPGFDRWHPGYELTPNMLQTLGEIMAFDAMIQNPDRQRGKNPNCAVLDEEIIAFDHEMAFQAAYSRTPPPWRDKGMDFLNRHAFRHLFSRRRLDLSRLRVEVEQLPAARIDEYREHIPPSWANPEVLDRLIGFLQGSVANRDTLLAKLEGL